MSELDKALLDYNSKDPNAVGGGWKVTPLPADKAANHMAYVARMVKEQIEARGDHYVPRPVSTIQTPHTTRVLAMTEDELKEYHARKIDVSKAQVWTEDQAKEALTKAEERNESMDGLIADGLRRSEKNTIGDALSEGLSGSSAEDKSNAVEAYLNTVAELSNIDRAMIKNADPKVFQGLAPQEIRKDGIIARFLNAFKFKQGDLDARVRWQDYVEKKK